MWVNATAVHAAPRVSMGEPARQSPNQEPAANDDFLAAAIACKDQLHGAGGLESDERLLRHLRRQEPLSIDGRQPGVRLRLRLLFNDPHVLLVDLHRILVDPQVAHDQTSRREELMLVVAALRRGQTLQDLLAVLHGLLSLDDHVAILPRDLNDDDVDDALNLTVGQLLQCRLALHQLLGEVLQRPGGADAQAARVDLVRLHELLELVHAQTDRRIDQRGELAVMRERRLDAPRRALGLGEPRIGGLVALAVRRHELAAANAETLEHLRIRALYRARQDLLAVDALHTWVGRRVLDLLEHLRVRGVEGHIDVGEAQPLHQPRRRADGVLVRPLLVPRHLIRVLPDAAVGVLHADLDEVLEAGARAVLEAEGDNVDDAHDMLVLGGVELQAGLPALDLGDELLEGLRLALAELVQGDVVVRQHLPDDVGAELVGVQVRALGLRRLGPSGAELLGLRRGPPLVGGAPARGRVQDDEALVGAGLQLQCAAHVHEAVPPSSACRRLLKALHQLLSPLPDAGVRPELHHLRLDVLGALAGFLLLHLALRSLHGGEEGVGQGLRGLEALGLVALEGLVDEVDALRRAPLREVQHLVLHVLLALERELARDEPVHDDADGPIVDLVPVVELEQLGGPIVPRPALLVQPLPLRQLADRAEVAEVQAVAHVGHILEVHHEVVALDVAVDATLGVQPGDSGMHLLAQVLDVPDWDHALRLPVRHHALDHVAALVVLEHHAHEDLLVVHVVQLDHGVVRKLVQHLGLSLDLGERSLDLVDHLHRELVVRAPLPALVDDTECALADLLPQLVLVQQLPSATLGVAVAVGHRGVLGSLRLRWRGPGGHHHAPDVHTSRPTPVRGA
mmetsp:Transcript_117284/g.328236  ORF Transcript_117284/g.328236 Transcript_117284/m.328236 type:complete len:852 (-) Transcript_117284:87-2642(-)